MTTVLTDHGVSIQYEYLHTIIWTVFDRFLLLLHLYPWYRYRDLAQGIIPQEEEVSSGEEPLGEGDIKLAMNRMQKLDKAMQKESRRKRKKGQDDDSEDEGTIFVEFGIILEQVTYVQVHFSWPVVDTECIKVRLHTPSTSPFLRVAHFIFFWCYAWREPLGP